jgi:hypothetical protein
MDIVKQVLKVCADWGPWALLILVPLLYWRLRQIGILDELNLWLTGSDVMIGRAFAHFLARRLKSHKGKVFFYNVPLATLDDDDDRKTLWEDCIVKNPALELYLLLSPQHAHDLVAKSQKSPVKEIVHQMCKRLRVVVVEFPSQERVNYGCVLLTEKGGAPLLVTASFTLRGFWNWNNNSFRCFLAFAPRRFAVIPSPVTHDMCESISNAAKDVIDAAQQGKTTCEFRYGPSDSERIVSKVLPEIIPVEELGKALARHNF